MELTIHHISLKEFVKLLPVMYGSIEYHRNTHNKNYMSGHIRICELEITLFSVEYDIILNVAKEYKEIA